RDGVRCEDVQALGYADASFDLFTSTEVFEHVPDDAAGFREIRRTLQPGGLTIFTVPLIRGASTVERARLRDGGIEHLLEPAWHGDRLRGAGKVLVFRDYGDDIVERLLAAGFARARLWRPPVDWFGHARGVVVGAAPVGFVCPAPTAGTPSSACSPPVSPGHDCGGRRWTGSAMPATWWSPMPEHRRLALLLLPLLAALCGFGPLPEDQARLRQAI